MVVLSSYHFIIFGQNSGVTRQSCTKDNSSDVFKAMDPLFSFWPLPSDVIHPKKYYYYYICCVRPIVLEDIIFAFEFCFDNTSCFNTRMKNILLGWFVIVGTNAFQIIQKTKNRRVRKQGALSKLRIKLFCRVVQLKLSSAAVTQLYGRIFP